MNRRGHELLQEAESRLGYPIEFSTPSLQGVAYYRGRKMVDLQVGPVYPSYDLASLTKLIFTVSVCLDLFDSGDLDLDRPVSDVLPWWRSRSISPRHLLTHTAGLPWWRPYYLTLASGPRPRTGRPDERWRQLEALLAKERGRPGRVARYSDLDFLLLGFVLEAISGMGLSDLWLKTKRRLGLMGTDFRPPAPVAPTEECPWRGRLLKGEVHDENAWALGGIAPHAGLFGSITDVVSWGLHLRRAYRQKGGSRLCSHKAARLFTRRALPRSVGDWGLGFMKPSRPRSSCGTRFFRSSFGHTGFTGTSLWYDPGRDLLVVILANRVHPTRQNSLFPDEVRPLLHDLIVEMAQRR